MTNLGTGCEVTFTLNDGHAIPAIGLGNFQGPMGMPEEQDIVTSVVHALKSGYRLLDCAMAYGCDRAIGRAIRESGVSRSEIVVMTKFWINFNDEPGAALDICLDGLGLDYVDIYLMHWPCAMTRDMQPIPYGLSPTFVDTWKKMEALVGDKCRSIGVCNFTQKTLDTLLANTTIIPAINQTELHAFNPNHRLHDYCRERGIHVVSWRTIGGMMSSNDVLTHPLFMSIAETHGCSVATVSLSWAVQRGCSVIPHSSRPDRLTANLKLVTLTLDEMRSINNAWKSIEKYRIADFIPQLQIPINGQQTILGWSREQLGWEDKEGNWLC